MDFLVRTYEILHQLTYDESVKNIFYGIMASTIFYILAKYIKYIKTSLSFIQEFSIDGCWLSKFRSVGGVDGVDKYEFIIIKHHGEFIRITYQSYSCLTDKINYYLGSGCGIYRSGNIFCPYSRKYPTSPVVGTYIFQEKQAKGKLFLSGYFVEYHDISKSKQFYIGPLVFFRINLPYRKRIKLLLSSNYRIFSNLHDLKKYTENDSIRDLVEISQVLSDGRSETFLN